MRSRRSCSTSTTRPGSSPRLHEPILEPDGDLREGYVPNVVYSCGGIVHDGMLWLPYGVGDQRVRAGAIDVTELLDAMTPVNGTA